MEAMAVAQWRQMRQITFADVSKAFDRVWIRGLILKLERYGVGENYCVGWKVT
jgi:hypothetical protein